MTVNLSEYRDLYLETARKLIDEYAVTKSSLITENTIQNLLRIFHSLKGQSMAMGYKNIADLSLHIETLCRKLIDEKTPLTSAVLDSFPAPITLYNDLDNIEKINKEMPLAHEVDSLEKITEGDKHHSINILIVDDDVFFQKVCIDKSRERSMLVDFAENGEDAIARLAIKKYDCILLDIIMPKKNGFEVLQYAKDNNINTPVIVFSTLGQEESIQKALSMGAVGFINKGDFNFDLLVSKIEAVIKKT